MPSTGCAAVDVYKRQPFEELHLDDPEHPDLRYASRLIMGRIAGLIGEQEEAANNPPRKE